jgi:hypothetical protein
MLMIDRKKKTYSNCDFDCIFIPKDPTFCQEQHLIQLTLFTSSAESIANKRPMQGLVNVCRQLPRQLRTSMASCGLIDNW